MKNIKFYLACVIVILISTLRGFSQTNPPLPKDVQINTPTDYLNYNKDIINCVGWLEKQPLNTNSDNINNVNAFILKWITNSPFTSLAFNGFITTCTQVNPELMLLFMGGAVRYCLQNNNAKDPLKLNMAGIEEIIKVYQSNKGVKKDPQIDDLILLKKQNKLEQFISTKIGTN